jgi:hypothetical protein
LRDKTGENDKGGSGGKTRRGVEGGNGGGDHPT